MEITLRAAEPDDEEAEDADQDEGRHRYVDRADLKRDEVVENMADAREVYRVAYAISARKHQLRVRYRQDVAHPVEHDQLIDAIDEKPKDIRRHHFAAFGAVEDGAAYISEQDRDRHAHDRGQQHSLPANDGPVSDEYEPNLPRHRAEDHAEVESHAGKYRDEKGEDEEGVSRQAREHLLYQICGGKA